MSTTGDPAGRSWHEVWHAIAKAGDVALTAYQLNQLDGYLDGLIEQNQKLNLTRIVDRNDAALKHVADSLTALKYVPSHARTLGDVGTGGGVPGAILAIARPDLRVTLIDGTKKKLDAVETICQSIGLKNARVLHARAESLSKNESKRFDVVTCRAVGLMPVLMGWCGPLVAKGGLLIALKGPRVVQELADTRLTNWRYQTHPVSHPGLDGHLIVTLRRG